MDVDEDLVVVGATGADDAPGCVDEACDSGSVYVFERNLGGANAWGQRAKRLADDGALDDNLGRSAAISGLTIIAGARTSEAGSDSGSAYVFVEALGAAVPGVATLGQLVLAVVFAGLVIWRVALRKPA